MNKRLSFILAAVLLMIGTSGCSSVPKCKPNAEFELCINGKKRKVNLRAAKGFLRQRRSDNGCVLYGQIIYAIDKPGFRPTPGIELRFYPDEIEAGQVVSISPSDEQPSFELEYQARKPIMKEDRVLRVKYSPQKPGGSAEVEFESVSNEMAGYVKGKIRYAKLIGYYSEKKSKWKKKTNTPTESNPPKPLTLQMYNVPFDVVLEKYPGVSVPNCPRDGS